MLGNEEQTDSFHFHGVSDTCSASVKRSTAVLTAPQMDTFSIGGRRERREEVRPEREGEKERLREAEKVERRKVFAAEVNKGAGGKS
jgi:hypothetical protein